MPATPPKTNSLEAKENGSSMAKSTNPFDDDEMPALEKDYIAAAEHKIADELKEGKVSIEYELGWKPEDKNVVSAARRPERDISTYRYVLGLPSSDIITELDIHKLKEKVKELEALKPETNSREDYKLDASKDLIKRIESWKPKDEYYGKEQNYHTETKKYTEKDPSANTKKAIDDYQEFADKVNKLRNSPIRNIYYTTVYRHDGTGGLSMYWRIVRSKTEVINGKTYDYVMPLHKYVREYDIAPEFKFKSGASIKQVKEELEEEAEEEKKKEEKKKTAVDKKAEKKKAEEEKTKKRLEKEAEKEAEKDKEEKRKLDADLKAGKNTQRVLRYKLKLLMEAYEKDEISYEDMKKQAKAIKEEFSKL